jgi:hypothetical protein
MVIKSCRYWKKCPCFYFWKSLQQNKNGNFFEIKFQKIGLLHTKRRRDSFCEDSNGHMLSRCCTNEESYVDQVQMTLARCAHVLDMLDFFGT